MGSDLMITKLSRALGARIEGVDLTQPLGDETFAAIHGALLEHQVVFVHDQDLSDEQQVALARRFGSPDVYPIALAAGSQNPLTTIEDTADRRPTSDNWHTDITWLPAPPKVALLNARVIPPFGGDTMWASLYALYDALSPPMQRFCESLQVRHAPEATFWRAARAALSPDKVAQLEADYPPVEHPLVCRHPETGRTTLFTSGDVFMEGIVGMHDAESRLLFDYFRTLLDDPNVSIRWHWRAHDLAIWDERATNHRALSDHFPQHRVVRRCTVAGDRPIAAMPHR